MVFVLRKAGMMNAEYETQMSDQELAKFNGQFEVYAKNDNTFLDIITVSNLAWDVNKRNGYDSKNSVTIEIKNGATTLYKITPNKDLEKNYFYDANNSKIYFYDAKYKDDILINAYDYDSEKEKVKYNYLFDCTGDESISYNDITGKVEKMVFTIKP